MVPPLSYALFLHEVFRHSDMVGASCPTGGLFTVLVDKTGEAVGFSAEGLVLKLIATHFANATPVELSGNSPQKPMAGTPMVDIPTRPTGSATYPVDVLAALSADRKTFYLSVVNPTEEEQVLSPRIAGVKLQDQGKLWQIAAASVDASNETDKKPVVEIIEHGGQQLAGPLRIPPISVNLYEFGIV